MPIQEPYYENNVTTKNSLKLTADLLKIPPSTDLPFAAIDVHTPVLKVSLRRGSMEPYYKSTSRRNTTTSSLSSYALLSDVFDYNYIDQYHLEEHENAIASDSDTDYEDFEGHVGKDETNDLDTDSDVDSELEDYNVHFLMFKVNSRAQFTRPPCTSEAAVSDWFDGQAPMHDFSAIAAFHHPKFAAPAMNPRLMGVEPLDDSVEDVLANYDLCCKNPLAVADVREQQAVRHVHVPSVAELAVSDVYYGAKAPIGPSDAYDTAPKEFFF